MYPGSPCSGGGLLIVNGVALVQKILVQNSLIIISEIVAYFKHVIWINFL